ncbi:transcriptional regulator [Caulobacter sp. CCUG 60055]|uniref:helix-turn-helix domain-containing protein n=3 Tax=Pseudomonadota TaxID=1224 RepID=UPI001FA7DDA5|nr:helix-turn-helix transcriptional regulator [Caulobacter sp. CCUG 60055]MCI3182333.1 transcriptional regulator [Caulobacter sp. CCUG 60055]
MGLSAEVDLSTEQSQAIAARVREELARRRISRQQLADDARISISTLEKALAGRRPFTLATTVRLEEALGAALRPRTAPAGAPPALGLAPEALGAYSRPAVAWLEGDYLTLRPSFETPEAVYAYRTEILWDEASSSLTFREAARLDAAFTQKGAVSLSNQSGHIYLVTNEQGQFRLAILGRPTIDGEMYGLLTTLHAGVGSQLTPAAAPIALVPLRRAPDAVFGRIAPGEPRHAAYRAALTRVAGQGFARMFAG